MTGELLLQALAQFGLPTAMLIGLSAYHIKVVRSKDGEISRINDARIAEKQGSTDQLLGIVGEFNELSREQTETLRLLESSSRRQGPRR